MQVQRHEEPVRVIERQRVDQHVVRPEPPEPVQRRRVRPEIVAREHRPLRPPRGPRGIEDRRQVAPLRAATCRSDGSRAACATSVPSPVAPEREQPPPPRHQRRDRVMGGRVAHHHLRLGVAEEIRQLRRRVPAVQRHIDRPHLQHRQIEADVADRLLHLHRHPVPRHDARGGEQRRDPPRALQEVGEAHRHPALGLEEHLPPVGREPRRPASRRGSRSRSSPPPDRDRRAANGPAAGFSSPAPCRSPRGSRRPRAPW